MVAKDDCKLSRQTARWPAGWGAASVISLQTDASLSESALRDEAVDEHGESLPGPLDGLLEGRLNLRLLSHEDSLGAQPLDRALVVREGELRRHGGPQKPDLVAVHLSMSLSTHKAGGGRASEKENGVSSRISSRARSCS